MDGYEYFYNVYNVIVCLPVLNRGSVLFSLSPEPNSPRPECKCGSAIAGLVSGSRWARTSTWTPRLRQHSTRQRRWWVSRPARSSPRPAANTELTASTAATTITRPRPRQTSIRLKVSTRARFHIFLAEDLAVVKWIRGRRHYILLGLRVFYSLSDRSISYLNHLIAETLTVFSAHIFSDRLFKNKYIELRF